MAPSGGPQNGLVGLFGNPNYATDFIAFSQLRLFTPVGSNITQGLFFIPGMNPPPAGDNPAAPALVTGFGAVFSDIDKPDGRGPRREQVPSTVIRYLGADGKVLFTGFVPGSPADASFSFFGIVYDQPLILRVQIVTGNVAPGPDDAGSQDVVVMDDFIYGEPQ
jgi:hypothetical protein